MWCRSSGTPRSTAVGDGGGHLQSLLLGAALIVMASLCVMLGIVSDLIRTNRVPHRDQPRAHQAGALRHPARAADPDDGRLL